MNNLIKHFSDINSNFNRMSKISIASMICSALVAAVSAGAAIWYANLKDNQIYILDDGKSLIALQTDEVSNKGLEVQDHVTRFHELFFSMSPNAESIRENLDKALNLSDQSVWQYSEDLAEKGYYSRLVSANISQQMMVDSVDVDTSVYPYQVTTHARQYVVRESKITVYSFESTCIVIDTKRSSSNPHGLIIEQFKVTKNDEIETRKR